MKNTIIFIVIIVAAILSGCGSPVSKDDIGNYGVEKFVQDSLSFIDTGDIHPDIQKNFKPNKIRTYLNGVLLVYSENNKRTKGIYVDKKDLSGWGGSGLEPTPWSNQVAWVRIKKR